MCAKPAEAVPRWLQIACKVTIHKAHHSPRTVDPLEKCLKRGQCTCPWDIDISYGPVAAEVLLQLRCPNACGKPPHKDLGWVHWLRTHHPWRVRIQRACMAQQGRSSREAGTVSAWCPHAALEGRVRAKAECTVVTFREHAHAQSQKEEGSVQRVSARYPTESDSYTVLHVSLPIPGETGSRRPIGNGAAYMGL